MASTTKRALIRGEVSIAEMVTITVKAIESPQAPFKFDGNCVTIAIPVVGSVSITFNAPDATH